MSCLGLRTATGFRLRPSYPPLPPADLQGEPLKQPQSREYSRLLQDLRQRELERFGDECPICPLDLDDVSMAKGNSSRTDLATHIVACFQLILIMDA